MLKSFLCPCHQEWLRSDAFRLKRCYEVSMETGRYFFDQSFWRDAVPHLGAAHESSEMLLDLSDRVETATKKFVNSTGLLLAALSNAGMTEEAFALYSCSVEKLESQKNLEVEKRFTLIGGMHLRWSEMALNDESLMARSVCLH